MNTQFFNKGCGLLAVAVLSLAGATSAFAGPPVPQQTRFQPRLRPLPPPVVTPSPAVPRLGFMGHVQYGFGMVVDSVSYGTFASRVGLERGDVIVRINNRKINSDHSYNDAVMDAVRFQRGFVDLLVIDVRTGQFRHRSGFVGHSGPTLPRSAPRFQASVNAF